jgi:hypothetical protein
MPEFLETPFASAAATVPGDVFIRLLVALLLGAAVAWIYLRSSRGLDVGSSFPITLVLLSVLIAMVTQVIGNNVARAFSLVGALSIVRFRTVVRDTRDTAYVIFAVVVGMAVGAGNLWVAALGIVVIGAASLLTPLRVRAQPPAAALYILRLRVPLGHSPESLAAARLDEFFEAREVVAVATAKLGATLDYTYEVRLRDGRAPEEAVRALSLLETVQDARIERLPEERL